MFNLREDDTQKPVTLPQVRLRAIEDDSKEIAARFAEQRAIRLGRDALESITRSNCFENWRAIGAALKIGRDFALKSSGANRPEGRNYCTAFNEWLQTHRFEIDKSLRSAALDMIENISAIEVWRSTLTERQRRRLAGPLQNVRRWRKATAQPRSADGVAKAAAAWSRFVAAVNLLPPEQAAQFWRNAHALCPNLNLVMS